MKQSLVFGAERSKASRPSRVLVFDLDLVMHFSKVIMNSTPKAQSTSRVTINLAPLYAQLESTRGSLLRDAFY